MSAPRDTSPDAWVRQLAAYRAMGPEARLRRAFELTEFVRALARDGIRAAHPDWAEARVDDELLRRSVGRLEPAPPRQ